MKFTATSRRSARLALSWSLGLAACATLRADIDPVRFQSIVDRNPFGLQPLPPPVTKENVPPPPPVQLATIKLTGITSMLAIRKACLEIIPAPGKAMLKPILSEGEKIDSVEVLTIDVERNQVLVRNGPVTTNLTFEVAKSTPVAPVGAGPGPGVPPGGSVGVAPPVHPSPATHPGPAPGRSGVMIAGGSSYATPGGAPAAPSSVDGRRPAQSTLSPEAAQIDMEQKRSRTTGLPYPPTLLSPRTPRLPGQAQ